MQTPYYSRGVFKDLGNMIEVRLFIGERMVRNYGILKAAKNLDHLPHLPHSVQEVADSWGNTVAVRDIL